MKRILLTLVALMVLSIGGAMPALAHKIKLFATVDGSTISGTVYVPGGGKVSGAEVTASAPDGARLGSATTDGDGTFSMPVDRRVDHLLEVATDDGHRATFRIDAAQLPAVLSGFRSEPGCGRSSRRTPCSGSLARGAGSCRRPRRGFASQSSTRTDRRL